MADQHAGPFFGDPPPTAAPGNPGGPAAPRGGTTRRPPRWDDIDEGGFGAEPPDGDEPAVTGWDDEPPPRRPSRRLKIVLAAAAVPWFVIGAIFLFTSPPPSPAEELEAMLGGDLDQILGGGLDEMLGGGLDEMLGGGLDEMLGGMLGGGMGGDLDVGLDALEYMLDPELLGRIIESGGLGDLLAGDLGAAFGGESTLDGGLEMPGFEVPGFEMPGFGPLAGGEMILHEMGRSVPGLSDAAAIGALVAREWLEGVGHRVSGDIGSAGTGAYVEHVAAEAVDFPAPGHAIVTVIAILLDIDGDAYHGARAVRIGVPVRMSGDGVRPAGEPWWLPPPDLQPTEPAWTTAVEDPTVLVDAGSALVAAGYTDVAVEELWAGDGWPLLVVTRAVAPGADAPETHRVWLREYLGGFIVGGTLP